MIHAKRRKLVFGILPLLCVVLAVACGGDEGDEEPSQTSTVCLNCSGLSGNAKLNCEIQNANKPGC